jgi:hypothetical protein
VETKKPNSTKKLKIDLLRVLLGMMGGELRRTPLKVSIINRGTVQLAPPLAREQWGCSYYSMGKSTFHAFWS